MPVAGAAHSIKTGLKSLRWTPDCANIVCTDPPGRDRRSLEQSYGPASHTRLINCYITPWDAKHKVD